MSYVILECLVCVVAGCGLATLLFLILLLIVVPIQYSYFCRAKCGAPSSRFHATSNSGSSGGMGRRAF